MSEWGGIKKWDDIKCFNCDLYNQKFAGDYAWILHECEVQVSKSYDNPLDLFRNCPFGDWNKSDKNDKIIARVNKVREKHLMEPMKIIGSIK